MMRIVRVLKSSKKNHCIYQNVLQGYRQPTQQATKMSTSSDALKEKLNEENLNGSKSIDTKRIDMYKTPPSEQKVLNLDQVQLPTDITRNIMHQNKMTLLKVITDMNSSSAVLLMKNLCSSRTRPVDVLNALSQKLQSDPPSSLIECSAVLYCAAVLNFRDFNLIKKIGEQIIQNKSEFVSHKLPTNIMRSLGVLKYDNQELLEVLMGSILFYKTETPEDLVTPLTTLALVNAQTPYTKSLIQVLSGYQEIDYSHPEAYLNYVWSCVILNELDPAHISRVLSKNFLNKVLESEKQKSILLKLQNVHGTASSLIKSYSGPFLPENYLNVSTITKSKNQFLEAVKNSLYYICPKEGFLKFNIDTEAGFLIDVKCCVNPQGEVVRLKENDVNKKVGIILLDYHDFCLGSEKMTGISAFKGRIVQAKDYKPLMIPYTEFSISGRLSEKIDYLRKKLRTVV